MKLETGYTDRFEVRHEQCTASTGSGFTVLYLSDFHFNTFSKNITKKIISTLQALDPDIVLLGGDYVDSKKGVMYLNELLQSLSGRKNVYAIAGNHDYFFGIEQIEKLMIENNVKWIEKQPVICNINNSIIKIDGNKIFAPDKKADFSIACLHKPIDIQSFKNQYQLAFAGHLHGSQLVLWQKGNALYPGKLFYRWNILKTSWNDCHYFISKGLGDSLPLRFNCSKDMIFVTVNSSYQNELI